MTTLINSYLQSLPSYFGSKRRLNRWIFTHLNKAIPRNEWVSLTFADAFVGGGSVSLTAKAVGFKQILANDWSDRSQIVIRGLLENQGLHLNPIYLACLTQPGRGNRWVEKELSPSVFSTRHARAMDTMLANIDEIQCPTSQALARLLLWHILGNYVCFGTSIGKSNRPYAEVLDGCRDWQTLNPKRFADGSMEKLFQPVWKNLDKYANRINKGVFYGSPVIGSQADVFSWLPGITADILYLDPPYPQTLDYTNANRILDRLLVGREPTGGVSPFNKGLDALWKLLDTSKHIPTWIISYGNALINLEGLTSGIRRIAPARRIIASEMPYKHLAHVSHNRDNREFIVVAY